MRSRSRRFLPLLSLSALLVGCGGPALSAAHHAEMPATPSGLTDGEFAGAVHDLLLATPGTPARAHLLAGVEGRQMQRAVARFRSHEAGRGLAAVVGGLYLMHSGELTSETLGPAARGAPSRGGA